MEFPRILFVLCYSEHSKNESLVTAEKECFDLFSINTHDTAFILKEMLPIELKAFKKNYEGSSRKLNICNKEGSVFVISFLCQRDSKYLFEGIIHIPLKYVPDLKEKDKEHVVFVTCSLNLDPYLVFYYWRFYQLLS